MTDRELMQMALDALFTCQEDWIFDGEDERPTKTYDEKLVSAAFKALRARLAQPEPEPVAWWQPNEYEIEKSFSWHKKGGFIKPLYTAPPQREWQGLTEYEVGFLTVFDGLHDVEVPLLANFIRHIEAKLKEKNAL